MPPKTVVAPPTRRRWSVVAGDSYGSIRRWAVRRLCHDIPAVFAFETLCTRGFTAVAPRLISTQVSRSCSLRPTRSEARLRHSSASGGSRSWRCTMTAGSLATSSTSAIIWACDQSVVRASRPSIACQRGRRSRNPVIKVSAPTVATLRLPRSPLPTATPTVRKIHPPDRAPITPTTRSPTRPCSPIPMICPVSSLPGSGFSGSAL